MAMIPSDALAIEIGLNRQRAIEEARAWNAEAIRLGELAWVYCEARDWPCLDISFSGIYVANPERAGEL